MATKWLCFMAHIKHSDKEYIKEQLKDFKYLFGMETCEYEHYHFLVEMSDKNYHAFAKRVFKDKYGLRGRAISGAPRQYGKVSQIRDIQKIARYTCKDKNIITNIGEEELDAILGQKLEECENTKTLSMDTIRKCCVFVENQIYGKKLMKSDNGQQQLEKVGSQMNEVVYLDEIPNACQIKLQIILWMRREKMNIRKTTIETYYLYIVAQSEHLKKTDIEIYNYLYED